MGKLLDLGTAVAIKGVVSYCVDIPCDMPSHEQRVHLFKEAAYYTLTEEELYDIMILNSEPETLRLYLKLFVINSC